MFSLHAPLGRIRLAFVVASAAALFVFARVYPDAEPERPAPPAVEIPAAAAPLDELARTPTFTPYTQGPELINRQEVSRALMRAYPPLLRDAGIGGTATVWFFLDQAGRVRDNRLQASSGHAALDEAALQVAAMMRFTPAVNRDHTTPVWVLLPITFQVR